MSFAVSLDEGRFEYGSSFGGYFGQRRNVVRPSFLRMTHDILRFNRLAPRLLDKMRGPRLHHRRLHRRRGPQRRLPRPLPGADGLVHLVDAARPHARLSRPELRALLQQPRPADDRTAAAVAHGERRQPVLCRAHRHAAARPGAAGDAGAGDPPRSAWCRGARRLGPLGPLRQGRAGLPCRPGAGAAGGCRRSGTRPARPLRLFLERGLAARRFVVDAEAAQCLVELELCRRPQIRGRAEA